MCLESRLSVPQRQDYCLSSAFLPLSPHPLCLHSASRAPCRFSLLLHVLLKGFWAYLGQMREHGLFSALCELIVVLAPLVLGISLQKKQVEHDLYFFCCFDQQIDVLFEAVIVDSDNVLVHKVSDSPSPLLDLQSI